MKIAMINGSPKTINSCSSYLIEEIIKLLDIKHEVITYSSDHKAANVEQFASIYNNEAIVFVFPLYVDGIPGHFVAYLEALEVYLKEQIKKNTRVYAVANCGFIEGEQTKYALEMIENFCEHTGLTWSFGLGIGAGPFLAESKGMPWQASIKKTIYQDLLTLKAGIEDEANSPNLFVSPKMSRRLYILAAHFGWRKQAKKNKLKPKDLYIQ